MSSLSLNALSSSSSFCFIYYLVKSSYVLSSFTVCIKVKVVHISLFLYGTITLPIAVLILVSLDTCLAVHSKASTPSVSIGSLP